MPAPPESSRTVHRTIGEERMVDHLLVAGHVHELRDGHEAAARMAASAALERWAGMGLGFARSASGGRLFDPAEVMNMSIDAGIKGRDGFWESRHVATSRQLVRDLHGDGPAGAVPSVLDTPPRRFRVRLERDFDLSRFDRGARVHLRLPRPLEDQSLRNLVATPTPLEGAQTSVEPGRFDYRFVVREDRLVTIAFDAEFDASPADGTGEGLTANERELYTRLPDGFIDGGPGLRHTANALAAPHGSDVAGVVQRMFDHVMDNLSFGTIQYGDLDAQAAASSAMAGGWCDCQLGSSLFCALCRAAGIAARVISGYPLYAAMAGNHYWAEAWIDGRGWLPYDFVGWHLSRGGRDAPWRNIFAGAIDHRMKLQVLPRLFTGVGSVPFPRYWHLLSQAVPGGVQVSYEEAATGELVYRERFFIQQ